MTDTTQTEAQTAPQDQAKAEAEARGTAIGRGVNFLGDTLTGYEEEGIVKAFGYAWSADELETSSTLRAFVFVLKKREGMNHADAKDAVMQMTARAVQDVIADYDPGEEVMPDEPVTEAGKDFSPLEDMPRSEPLGV